MKKSFILLLVLAFVVSMAACGTKEQRTEVNASADDAGEMEACSYASDCLEYAHVVIHARPDVQRCHLVQICVCIFANRGRSGVGKVFAQTMAERGFLTIAFDPSYTGESGGEPRYMASPDINTEDFQAAVEWQSIFS